MMLSGHSLIFMVLLVEKPLTKGTFVLTVMRSKFIGNILMSIQLISLEIKCNFYQ